MAISETDNLKNNEDLTQHFLYTYSHIEKIGPNEKIRKVFNDDLIFDRSRKSIFTQSQEYGYVSDTVYTVSVGNKVNDGNTYLTFRSYEGNLEFYQYTPLKLTSIEYSTASNSDEYFSEEKVYHVGDKFQLNGIVVSYESNGIVQSATVSFNDQKYTESDLILSALNNRFSFNRDQANKAFINGFIKGSNKLKVEATTSPEYSYINFLDNEQHRTIERFQKGTYIWNSSIEKEIFAYYHTYIMVIPYSYYQILDNPNYITGAESQIVYRKTTDNYWKSFRKDPYICKNGKNNTICLGVPKEQEDNKQIFALVGGTATEMTKVKSMKFDGNQDYNFYIGKSDNWNGLSLSFQKNN